jgi:hypothetical protein
MIAGFFLGAVLTLAVVLGLIVWYFKDFKIWP